jgi:hypothetical protein
MRRRARSAMVPAAKRGRLMKGHEFWRERASGEVWAIELVDGVVAGCCGPLEHNELEEGFLETFDYTAERSSWVEAHRADFDLYDPVRG